MSKEAQIKAILEDYLNLESSLNDYSRVREEALKKYNRLLDEHHSPNNNYTTHTAVPIISAHDEMQNLDKIINDTRHKRNEAGGKIKEYIHVLRGRSLEVHFTFDALTHRSGTHTFFIENEELKVSYSPEKI